MTTTLQQPQGDTLSSADLAGSPAMTPEMIIGDLVSTAVKGDGPGLVPPGVQASASAGAASLAATTTIATMTGLWTNNATSNAWAYLAGKGWRKLSSANVIAHQALLQLARVARDRVLVALDERPGTGYTWTVEALPSGARLAEHYEHEDAGIGGGRATS